MIKFCKSYSSFQLFFLISLAFICFSLFSISEAKANEYIDEIVFESDGLYSIAGDKTHFFFIKSGENRIWHASTDTFQPDYYFDIDPAITIVDIAFNSSANEIILSSSYCNAGGFTGSKKYVFKVDGTFISETCSGHGSVHSNLTSGPTHNYGITLNSGWGAYFNSDWTWGGRLNYGWSDGTASAIAISPDELILYVAISGSIFSASPELEYHGLTGVYDEKETALPNGEKIEDLIVLNTEHSFLYLNKEKVHLFTDNIFVDSDNDGIPDTADNCISTPNPDQADWDDDKIGDTCDLDDDNDSIEDVYDNCPLEENADQIDSDYDSIGDACDFTFDAGTIVDALESEAGWSVDILIQIDPPGVNGMISKISGKGSVIAKVATSEVDFTNGDIDTITFINKLHSALSQLKDFETQLYEKIDGSKIIEPEASKLKDHIYNMRSMINNLIIAFY